MITNHADYINAAFEFFGSIFLTLNCFRLYKDKVIKGVSVLPTMFYSSWGAWNLYFYPVTGNYWSAVAGVLVFLANATWVGMALYYNRRNRNVIAVTN